MVDELLSFFSQEKISQAEKENLQKIYILI